MGMQILEMIIVKVLLFCSFVKCSKEQRIQELNVISDYAKRTIREFFPNVEEQSKQKWLGVVQRKRNQLVRLLSLPECYDKQRVDDHETTFELAPTPTCDGIQALSHMEASYQEWLKEFILLDCRSDFRQRISARLMSFVSKLYVHVQLAPRCNQLKTRLDRDELDKKANSTNSCPNASKFGMESQLFN